MHCTQQHEHDHRQHAVRMISSVRDCAEAYCRTQRANGEQGTLGRKRTEGDCERGRQQKRTLFTRTIVGLTEPVRWVQVRRTEGVASQRADAFGAAPSGKPVPGEPAAACSRSKKSLMLNLKNSYMYSRRVKLKE